MSTTTFQKGYALLIGVSEQLNPNQAASLPATEKDVNNLHQVLLDPAKCGYESDRVTVLLGKEATRANIMREIGNLMVKMTIDTEATALIYFSGHGYRKAAEDKFYLIPYDFDIHNPSRTAIEDRDFSRLVNQLSGRGVLLLLDSCHSGDTGAILGAPEGFDTKAIDINSILDPGISKDIKDAGSGGSGGSSGSKPILDPNNHGDGEKGIEDAGSGGSGGSSGSKPVGEDKNSSGEATRAVLVSSRDKELSYIDLEAGISVFTYHLIEALNGHGKNSGVSSTVNVLDIMSYVTDPNTVSATTRRLHNASQTPNARYMGENFPIAMLQGGKGIGEKGAPTREELLESIQGVNQTVNNIHNEASVRGDGNITLQGNEGDVSINSNINIDKSNHSTHTDNSISVGGNVTGSAIGQNNRVDNSTHTHISSLPMPDAFQQVLQQIDQSPSIAPAAKDEVRATVQEIEAGIEAANNGNEPRGSKVMAWLELLKEKAPGILDSVADIIQDPRQGVSIGIRAIADMIRPKTHA